MTDRINALTVVLEKDIRDDDIQPVLNAILLIKGVVRVTNHIVGIEDWAAETRANTKLRDKLIKLIEEL